MPQLDVGSGFREQLTKAKDLLTSEFEAEVGVSLEDNVSAICVHYRALGAQAKERIVATTSRVLTAEGLL